MAEGIIIDGVGTLSDDNDLGEEVLERAAKEEEDPIEEVGENLDDADSRPKMSLSISNFLGLERGRPLVLELVKDEGEVKGFAADTVDIEGV